MEGQRLLVQKRAIESVSKRHVRKVQETDPIADSAALWPYVACTQGWRLW